MSQHETSQAASGMTNTGVRRRRRIIAAAGLIFAVAATAVGLPSLWEGATGSRHAGLSHIAAGSSHVAESREKQDAPKDRVDVVLAEPGGFARTVEVPGTARAFDYANLYARVSGYLKVQSVDIGDKVTKGQLLAELDVPELEEDVLRHRAQLGLAEAQLQQKQAAIQTALADEDVAKSAVLQAEAEVGRATAAQSFREKQYNRMKDLRGMKAIDDRLVDEKQDEHESAISASEAAKAKVVTAKSQVAACTAKVVEARANFEEAKSRVAVAKADLQKGEVLLKYSRIVSPYDGVITSRTFHIGDFIQSADQGGRTPILQVQNIDVMRLVVQIPDRDVAYVDVGDQVEFKVDGLAGEVRQGRVSRFSFSEDERTRSMRTEIDLKNVDGKLRDGMYGQVVVHLHDANPKAVHIPSACVMKSKREGAKVFVSRDGKLHLTPVQIGMDNGVVVEVTQGLAANQQVVFAPGGDLVDGAVVEPVLKASPAQ